MYPFQYQLPPNLPGVVEIASNAASTRMSDFTGSVRYKLAVRLGVKGFLVADLATKQPFRLHAMLPPDRPIRALVVSVSESVRFLMLFKKGNCEVHAVLNKNVQVSGGQLFIDAQIHNGSRKKIRKISLQLLQEITLLGKARGWENEVSETICERDFPGVAAETSVQTRLALALIESNRRPIPKSTHGELFAVRYFLRMRCKMNGCPSVRLEFPLTVIASASISHISNKRDTTN